MNRRDILKVLAFTGLFTVEYTKRANHCRAGETKLPHKENARLLYPKKEIVDPSTMTHKILCGYQGWFNAQEDGAGRGYAHWARGGRRPESETISVELWPDLSEFAPEERYQTGFHLGDGRTAEVFSSFIASTVHRHFEWMKEYGIDGVFLQRFLVQTYGDRGRAHCDKVLESVMNASEKTGRVWGLMYDLSGTREGDVSKLVNDLNDLCARYRLKDHPRYLHHDGKPVISVWGIGFNDGRRYTPQECGDLIDCLKSNPELGEFSVMLGTPTGWQKLNRDCIPDESVRDLFAKGDIISPWTVGRYRSIPEAEHHANRDWKPDIEHCRANSQVYMPVVFPGFSWSNLRPGSRFNDIPRLNGDFYWAQLMAAINAGADTIYVAMFDEVDEGTAIFKCTNELPVDVPNQFLTYEGLPSDHYLKLTGLASAMLRNEIEKDDWRKFI